MAPKPGDKCPICSAGPLTATPLGSLRCTRCSALIIIPAPVAPPTPKCPQCAGSGVLTERVHEMSGKLVAEVFRCYSCDHHWVVEAPSTGATPIPTGGAGTAKRPLFRKNGREPWTPDQELHESPWKASIDWMDHATEGYGGVPIWWPKGLTQERREHFMEEALVLLQHTGMSNPDEEMYAVADNLFRMWVEWLKAKA